MKSADKIEKKIKNIKLCTRRVTDERILGAASAALKESTRKSSKASSKSVGRIIMKSKITKFAIAAAVMIIVLVGLYSHDGSLDPATITSDRTTAKLVPLKIELPRPIFQGTPKNVQAENLDPILPKNIPPVKVPLGVVNVALNKNVTSSEEDPFLGDLEQITDGDKQGIDGSYVELAFGSQWIQIDLEEEYRIYAIVVWHYHAEDRVYHDIVVRIDNDQDFIDPITVFNNDYDNSSGFGIGKNPQYIETNYGRQISVAAVQGRYVRLYSRGNTSNSENHYIEVEVYALPIK